MSDGDNLRRAHTPGSKRRHRRQTVNTTDSTTASSARLHSVQQLLEKLGSMKARGLGARERLDFLQRQGPELVHDFTFEDAFDADARASSARLGQLDELSSSVRQLKTAWRSAPIQDDVRAAGLSLIGHITGFVQQAEKLERESEIDMLSQLWEQAPDVSSTWPELGTQARPSRELHVQQSPEDSLSRPGDGELEKVKSELEDELTEENVKETTLPTEGAQLRDEFKKLWPKANLDNSWNPELEKRALEKHRQFVRQFETDHSSDFLEPPPGRTLGEVGIPHFDTKFLEVEDGQVVGKVSNRESGSPELEDMSKLKQQAWTEAVREATLEPWRLEVWSSGRRRELSMRWMLERDKAAYIRLETSRGREKGKHRVRLEWTDPRIRLGSFERELSDDELEELHLDPSSFVAEALESSG